MPKESIPQLPGCSLQADSFFGRMLGHIFAIAQKFQIVLMCQIGYECLISLRLRPAQLVIEMYDRKNDPQLAAQLQQQSQERNRIDPT
jgi:hypothetical protein